MVRAMSASTWLTACVVRERESFDGVGSDAGPRDNETEGAFVYKAGAVGVARIVTVTGVSGGRSSNEQTTMVEPVQDPRLEVADMKVRPAGSGSVRVAPVANCGPLFVTVRL